MRYGHETRATQPRAGGDDVVVRHTGGMTDEHRRARGEQPMQRLTGELVAWQSSIEQSPISAATRWRCLAVRVIASINGIPLREITLDFVQNHRPPWSCRRCLVASR